MSALKDKEFRHAYDAALVHFGLSDGMEDPQNQMIQTCDNNHFEAMKAPGTKASFGRPAGSDLSDKAISED